MISILYNRYKAEDLKGNIDLVNDTIKVALLTSSYTPDIDAHENFDDVSADEVSGTNYTAGGKTLTNKSVVQNDTSDKGVFDADDINWENSTITARYAVLYKDTGTPSTSTLIGYIDFEGDEISDSGHFTINWDTTGILTLANN